MKKERILALKKLNQNMESCNGGSMRWQLGETVTVKGKIQMCSRGIHLTFEPSDWRGSRVFIAETFEVVDAQGNKIVCRSAKLLLELSPSLLKAYEEGQASLLKAYLEGNASLWKAYEEGNAPLWKAYEEGKASLWKAYEEGNTPLWKAYLEGKAPLWKAYADKLQVVLVAILTQAAAEASFQ